MSYTVGPEMTGGHLIKDCMLVHVLLGLRARFSTCTLLKHHTVSTIVSHQGYAYILLLLLYNFVIIIPYLAGLSPAKNALTNC